MSKRLDTIFLQKMQRRALKAVLFLGSIFMAGSVALSTSAQAARKNLIYCAEASPSGFDPALYTDGATFIASSLPVYSRLVDFKRGTTDIVPALAESWDISPDGKTYTFHLRKGVKFQKTKYFKPTRDFNADDVVFSFDRQVNKNNPWHDYLDGQSYEYYAAMDMPNIIKSVKKLDDNTVQFELNHPEAPFLSDLAMHFTSIVSKEYADSLQASGNMHQFNAKPVGTGPFTWLAYQKDSVVRFRANPDYWGGKQNIDNLIYAITTDNAVRAQKMRAGECQVMSSPAPTDIPMLEADKKIDVKKGVGMNVSYLAYNTQKKPFDNVDVRRALNMAVNKKALVKIVFGEQGNIANSPIPPSLWGYNDKIPEDEYNPAKARQLLEKAGVKDLHVELWALPVSRPYMPNGRRAAELLQSDWKQIGVSTDVVTMEWGEYLKAANNKNRDSIAMMGWIGDNGDPDNFLSVLNSCASVGMGNYAMWCNTDYDALINKAKVLSDKKERTKLYEQAQAIFKQQAPWLVIANGSNIVPVSKRVKNFQVDVNGIRFDGVDIE